MALAPKISRTQTIAIYTRLSDLIEKLDNGMCRYRNPEHSDATVATEFSCSHNSVAGVRKELFGNLVSKREPGASDTAAIAALQAELNNLNSRYLQVLAGLNELIVKHNRLCETLSLNRVAEVKHLTMLSETKGTGTAQATPRHS